MLVPLHELNHEDLQFDQGQVFPQAAPWSATEDKRYKLLVLFALFFFPSFGDELEGLFENVGVEEDVEPIAANDGPFLDRHAAYCRVFGKQSIENARS
jgi:hypothetical protein